MCRRSQQLKNRRTRQLHLVFQVKPGGERPASSSKGAVPEGVDTATPQTQGKNSSMMWLIGDGNNARRKQFEKAGWTIGYSICGSTGRHKVRFRMSADQPRLLYIVNFGGMAGNAETSTFLSNLMYDQLNLRGLILLEAPESSKFWQMPHGKLTEHRDWHPTVTRWCGLAVQSTQSAKGERRSDTHSTSKRSTYVRSNFPLEDRRNCNCGRSWNDHTSENGRNEDGNSAFAAYMATLLSERYFIGHACVLSLIHI